MSDTGFKILINLFISVLAAPGLLCCLWALSSSGKRGQLSGCDAQASYCSGFSWCRAQALERAGFSS